MKNQTQELDMFQKKTKALLTKVQEARVGQAVRKLAVVSGNVGKLLTA